MRYSPVSSRAGFAAAEVEILDHWKRSRLFERTLEWRRGAPPFVFYEGPPTANGLPGLHHVLSRAFKDVFGRYKQMAGFSVERKAGWDTHGLPVELEIERSLKISGKKQIEEYGVARFNALCKESVNRYIDQWRPLLDRGVMLGAFDGDHLAGFAIYTPPGTRDFAQLSVLHVSRLYRRTGIGRRLADEVLALARGNGATRLYVSATPTRGTVDFYMSCGFEPLATPDPELFALEPDDIHLDMRL